MKLKLNLIRPVRAVVLALMLLHSGNIPAQEATPDRAGPTPTADPLLAANLRQVGELVRSGKIAEARQLAERTRALYPEDTQVKATLERLSTLAAAKTPSEAATPAKVTPAATPAPGNAGAPAFPTHTTKPKMSSEDRLLADTLEAIQQELAGETDVAKRQLLCREYLSQSKALVARNPQLEGVWLARAVAALELNDVESGWEAGANLKRLGAMESEDQQTRKTLAQLNRKGWLDATTVKRAIESQAAKNWWLGKWSGKDEKLNDQYGCHYLQKLTMNISLASQGQFGVESLDWQECKGNRIDLYYAYSTQVPGPYSFTSSRAASNSGKCKIVDVKASDDCAQLRISYEINDNKSPFQQHLVAIRKGETIEVMKYANDGVTCLYQSPVLLSRQKP